MTHRVAVVGGAGFIGSHLVAACVDRGAEVWVYDNFTTGRREFLPVTPAVRVVEGDILDTDSLSRMVGECNPDVLYHLAAIHHIPTCERLPAQALRTNVEGTSSVLRACAANDVGRAVVASTGALYDPRHTAALTESSPVRVTDIYSISKLATEELAEYYASKHGGQAVIARLFNAVGRNETNPHLIPDLMKQLLMGSRRVRLGNLHPRRDYVHATDLAEALFRLGGIAIAERFDVFNVGSGRDYSVKELVDVCAEVISERIEIESVPELQRKVDRPNQLADVSKLTAATGWRPERTLRQALAEVWEEHTA